MTPRKELPPNRLNQLRELVRANVYVVDARAVADAVLRARLVQQPRRIARLIPAGAQSRQAGPQSQGDPPT